MTAPHLGPGHTVAGNYTIRAILGFTGESATYHAVSGAGHEVVIKLYDPALGQRADVMGELERVRGQVAALPPGGVVPVIDGGYDVGTGAPFEVTEYLRIPSIASLLSQRLLPVEVVAQIMNGLSQILDQGQAQQLSHLALKPTNIFVGPAPGYQVRVTDFAASVVRRASPTHEAYIHSAPWWAPEQLQPAAVLGPAADVFSAALVAFYALTGRPYWLSCQQHPPDLAAWQAEVMGQRAPVSQRARELGAVVNSIVDDVFARALSVNQADRPRSVSELAAVLAGQGGGASREQARTMAFPEGIFPPMGDDAPFEPPPAFGGAAPGPDGGASSPYGAPTAGAAMASGGGTGAAAQAADTVTPGLPPMPPAKKKEKSTLVPIIIGVVAAIVLGGTGVLLLFMGGDDETGPTTVATDAGASDPDGEGGSASSAAGVGAEDEPPGEGGGRGEGGAPVDEPKTVAATIRCKPACDELLIDNEKVDQDKPLDLVPGKHTVVGSKTGYLPLKTDLMIPAGGPFEKEYPLVPITGPKPIPKPCKQFLGCD